MKINFRAQPEAQRLLHFGLPTNRKIVKCITLAYQNYMQKVYLIKVYFRAEPTEAHRLLRNRYVFEQARAQLVLKYRMLYTEN